MNAQEPLIFPADFITPPPGERVMVITDDVLCPGYIDFDGSWHLESDGGRLVNVLGWSPTN